MAVPIGQDVRAWWTWMTAGVPACAGYLLLPVGSVASVVVDNGVGAASVVALVCGVRAQAVGAGRSARPCSCRSPSATA